MARTYRDLLEHLAAACSPPRTVAQLEEEIARDVAKAPPLTDEQWQRISALLSA